MYQYQVEAAVKFCVYMSTVPFFVLRLLSYHVDPYSHTICRSRLLGSLTPRRAVSSDVCGCVRLLTSN